ncbi:MAG: M15 family metallopeptidase [Christensenellales bacterium]
MRFAGFKKVSSHIIKGGRFVALGIAVVMLLAGCGSEAAEAVSTQTPPSKAAQTTPAPTSNAIVTVSPASTPKPTETPPIERAADLPRDENGIVTLSVEFIDPIALMVSAKQVNVRDKPDADAGKRITTATLGQQMLSTHVIDGWFEVTVLPGMQQGFVRSDFAEDYDSARIFFARPAKQDIVTKAKDGTETTLVNNLVDVREYAPDIVYNIVFATPDNYTSKTLYSRDACLLQKGTAQKLAKAQEMFKADGYSIKIYDGYRPGSVSGELYKVVPDSKYVAPAGSSNHNRGAAVDITLVDSDGNELEMPSAVMELNEKAGRNQKGMSKAAKANMDYLTSIMQKCGFTTYSAEWWHYTDKNAKQFPVSDLDFTKLHYIENLP